MIKKRGYKVWHTFESMGLGPERPGHYEPAPMTDEENKEYLRAMDALKELENNPWIFWSRDDGPVLEPRRTKRWVFDD